MLAWVENGVDDYIPVIYCDCCGQQCNVYKNGQYITCDEIDGKWYCSECLEQEFYREN